MMIILRIDAHHQKVSEADIKADYTILNKHLRINELLHEYSRFSIFCLLFIIVIIAKVIKIIKVVIIFIIIKFIKKL